MGNGQEKDLAKVEVGSSQVEQAMRWRLILGRFADEQLGMNRLQGMAGDVGGLDASGGADLQAMMGEAQRMEMPLQYLYDREFAQRSHRSTGGGDSSGLTVPLWLNQVRELFPREAVEILEQDALSRYGLTQLVTDPEILKKAQPTEQLMYAVLQFKHMMKGEVLGVARDVVREVVKELSEKFLKECYAALHGVFDPEARPPQKTFRNADWKKTIRRNLKNYDPEEERLVVERIFYKHRQKKRSPWRIIVSVDQSGSMLDKLVHSAVMAAIFATLPSVEVNLVCWDTRIIDFSSIAKDPLEVLMSCQLGGGNDDTGALQYCFGLVTDPQHTILITISDWYICVPEKPYLALAHQVHEAGVRCIGLSALDTECRPVYNEDIAKKLAGCGWFVAALTPKKLAEYIGKIIA